MDEKSCAEFTNCIRNMLTTYDQLWGLGWKQHLEPIMVDYFENFESSTNTIIDWNFAAKTMILLFYLVQRAAHSPTKGICASAVGSPGQVGVPSTLARIHPENDEGEC